MTPHDLISAIEATGLKQQQIADRLGVTRQTISNWKFGRRQMPKSARMLLEMILEKVERGMCDGH